MNSVYAYIDENGYLTTTDANGYQFCTVTATFEGKSDSHSLVITDNTIHEVDIQRSAVKAGRTIGFDRLYFLGLFNVTEELLDAADNVTVQIYSASDIYVF